VKKIPQAIPEVILIEPEVHGDERGYFIETYRQDKLEEIIGYKVEFVQDNESKSSRGVLRGLHFQMPPYAQSKLVRVIEGDVLDVVVDLRHGSPTYGRHVAAILNDKNKRQLFVPRGFAHGFVVLSDTAVFAYKVDNYYSPENDRGLAFDDASLLIDWGLPKNQLMVSEKDLKQPRLEELGQCFNYRENYYDE